ncbi:MAG: octaprenyl diphosphate synthase [Legionellales bacterium]|nr:octaprenyl diphosphate synthase [Legionellales bacterium]|tara:strand:+ start:9587 stop:10555 length:969 start_codon:yes stop_codon:yes gene_type:complete
MDLENIRSLVADDMQAVDNLINQHLASDILLIDQLGHYITRSGGKRVRPMLVLLSARAFGYQGDKHIDLAAITEFIHTATLLHDDVVDASELRRGHETANAIWGNEASVLVGDFLFSRAFQMMANVQSLRVMEILANASNTIAEGEVLQLMNCHNPETTTEQYMDVIKAKTATLFAAASHLGAVISEQSIETQHAMAQYGMAIGCAFQLVDDVLDYSSDAETLGKNLGDDLAEGKPTLPLIYAMHKGSEAERALIVAAVKAGDITKLPDIQAVIASTQAIEYTYAAAEKQVGMAKHALTDVPDSAFKEALSALADFTLRRKF